MDRDNNKDDNSNNEVTQIVSPNDEEREKKRILVEDIKFTSSSGKEYKIWAGDGDYPIIAAISRLLIETSLYSRFEAILKKSQIRNKIEFYNNTLVC